jgi:drug/metabolite transporter (DMT)-like permease
VSSTPEGHPLARGLPWFLAGGLALSSLDATAKWLVQDHALLLVVWARYAGQTVVMAPFTMHRGGRYFWRTARLRDQLLRSGFLLGATVFFFAGLRYLPLAEASAITFLAPAFVAILAGPMLGERATRARWIAVGVGFLGTVLLARPGSAVFHPAALMLLGTAMCNGLYAIYTRKLVGENVYTTLFYSSLVGTVLTTIALPFALIEDVHTLANVRTLGLFAAAGLFAGLGHFWLITAMQRAPASLLTPFTYMQVLWATTYGYLIFGHLPDRWSFIGMTVIVLSGIGLAQAERRRSLALARVLP